MNAAGRVVLRVVSSLFPRTRCGGVVAGDLGWDCPWRALGGHLRIFWEFLIFEVLLSLNLEELAPKVRQMMEKWSQVTHSPALSLSLSVSQKKLSVWGYLPFPPLMHTHKELRRFRFGWKKRKCMRAHYPLRQTK